MDILEKEQLMQEYIKRFKYLIYWPLKIAGFCRFDIKNTRIVDLKLSSLAYKLFILILADISVGIIIYTEGTQENSLKFSDKIILTHSAAFVNLILLNSIILNRRTGLEIIHYCIEIDALLGNIDTYFMRDISVNMYIIFTAIIAFSQISVCVFLFVAYDVSVTIHILGTFYLAWLFFVYYDFCFFLMIYSFMILRVRYLNVAIIKRGNMNEEYLPRPFLFSSFLWKKKYDRLVTFQEKANTIEFNMGYKMLFNLFQCLQNVYRFPIILGVWTIVSGSFILVQMFVIRFQNSVENVIVDEVQAYTITGWVVMSWFFMALVTLVTDMFCQQIEQTKLICAYIQLKPTNSAEVFKLTKSILRTVELRDSRPSVYGIFSLDTGLVLRIAASTLVYITVQLQLAFPKLSLSNNNKLSNYTTSP